MTINNRLYALLAGFRIEVNFKITDENLLKRSYHNFFEFLFNFLVIRSNAKSDFSIDVIDSTVKEIMKKEGNIFRKIIGKSVYKDRLITYSTVDTYDINLIFKYIISQLYDRTDSLILHASAVLVNNSAYLFLGNSGAGKSTIVQMLNEKYRPLCDDAAYIRKKNGGYYFYQSPFFERNKFLKSPDNIKIGKIFFLKKEKSFRVQKIRLTPDEAFRLFSRQIVNRPNNRAVFDFFSMYGDRMNDLLFSKGDRGVIVLD